MSELDVNYRYEQDKNVVLLRLVNTTDRNITLADTIYYGKDNLPGFLGFNFTTTERHKPTGFQCPVLRTEISLGYPRLISLSPSSKLTKILPINSLFEPLRQTETEQLMGFQVRVTLFFDRYLSVKKSFKSRFYEIRSLVKQTD